MKAESKIVKYRYRAYSDEGADQFLSDLNTQTWGRVYEAPNPEAKAVVFAELIESLLDKKFKWKTVTRKEGEVPWINDSIRRLWRKRGNAL